MGLVEIGQLGLHYALHAKKIVLGVFGMLHKLPQAKIRNLKPDHSVPNPDLDHPLPALPSFTPTSTREANIPTNNDALDTDIGHASGHQDLVMFTPATAETCDSENSNSNPTRWALTRNVDSQRIYPLSILRSRFEPRPPQFSKG